MRARVSAGVAFGLALGVACADLDKLTVQDDGGPGVGDSGGPEGSGGDGASSCATPLPDGGPRPGPTMVRVDAPSGGYCIDTTEVTNGTFNGFLAAGAPLASHPPGGCQKDASPPAMVQDPGLADVPVEGITICYAAAYCAWAGKRLCGQLGDGGLVNGNDENEWSYACANGARDTVYPYGETFVDKTCNVGTGATADAGAYPACHGLDGGFAKIFDMTGNVAEFINNASTGGNLAALGESYAPSYNSGGYDKGCTFAVNFNGAAQGVGSVGFRCCAHE